ncbi:olfactory receptor 51G2-like [Podarcis lilfordi]|uniref:Olfactory receptor 51G2-like n=1 Tax=Podarcis lilfordi TaxID=74358 RepID=A0AA35P670_9SAUR|nr:olfactory receptor 51G2-like [Podarcis lilfordi]
MKLACHKSSRDGIYGLLVVFSTMGLDPLLIVLSYIWILKTVVAITSLDERHKALNTCACHISVVLLFYTPMLALSLISRLTLHTPPFLHILLSYIHFLAPPLLNPVLYCVKMKETVMLLETTGVPSSEDRKGQKVVRNSLDILHALTNVGW